MIEWTRGLAKSRRALHSIPPTACPAEALVLSIDRQASEVTMRSASGFQGGAASGQSPALIARINEKKIELENLRELRDLSAQLAGQMEMLEEKLGTLANGTEGIYVFLDESRASMSDPSSCGDYIIELA